MLLPGPLPMYATVGPICCVSPMLQRQNACQKQLGGGNTFGSQFLRTCHCTEVWEWVLKAGQVQRVCGYTHGTGEYA